MSGISLKVFLRALSTKEFKRVIVYAPIEVTKKIEIIYLFLYKNGIGFHLLVSLFFAFSVDTFFELIEEKKITNVWQMIRLMKCVKRSMRAYLEIAKENHPMIQLNTLRYIYREMHKMAFPEEYKIEFFNYLIENNSNILGERIVLDERDIREVMCKWIDDKAKARTIDDIEGSTE